MHTTHTLLSFGVIIYWLILWCSNIYLLQFQVDCTHVYQSKRMQVESIAQCPHIISHQGKIYFAQTFQFCTDTVESPNNPCLKLSKKKFKVLMPWISNNKHKIVEKLIPVLIQSCRPRTGRPVGISNTANNMISLAVQERRSSIANALELRLSYTKPSICYNMELIW